MDLCNFHSKNEILQTTIKYAHASYAHPNVHHGDFRATLAASLDSEARPTLLNQETFYNTFALLPVMEKMRNSTSAQKNVTIDSYGQHYQVRQRLLRTVGK